MWNKTYRSAVSLYFSPFLMPMRVFVYLTVTVGIVCMACAALSALSASDAAAESREVIVLTGYDLTLDDVVKIAENRADIRISPEGIKRIKDAREVIEYYVKNNIPAYGINTMYGEDVDVVVPQDKIERWNRVNIIQETTKIGDGSRPFLKPSVVRATWALLVNSYARGFSGASLGLAEEIVARVNANRIPTEIEVGGSMGDADLIMNNKLALSLYENPDFEVGAGEATILMTHNFIQIAKADLIAKRVERLLARAEVALALSMEGFRANPSPFSESAMKGAVRANKRKIQKEMQFLLKGSKLWGKVGEKGGPRNLQDNLSMRVSTDVLAAVETSLQRLEKTLLEYSNALAVSPMVDVETKNIVSVTEYDPTQLTLDMDNFRQALGVMAISIDSRSLKVMSRPFIDLPSGLASDEHDPSKYDGLYTRNITYWMTSILREALLQYSQPVTMMTASFGAEGHEDISAPLPNSVAMLENLVDSLEKMVTIEALIGSFALQRRIELGQLTENDVPPSLRAVLKEIIKRSPMQIPPDEQYSLGPLLKYFIQEYQPPTL